MQWFYSFCRKSYLLKHFLTCKNINLASIHLKNISWLVMESVSQSPTRAKEWVEQKFKKFFLHFLYFLVIIFDDMNHGLNICGTDFLLEKWRIIVFIKFNLLLLSPKENTLTIFFSSGLRLPVHVYKKVGECPKLNNRNSLVRVVG